MKLLLEPAKRARKVRIRAVRLRIAGMKARILMLMIVVVERLMVSWIV